MVPSRESVEPPVSSDGNASLIARLRQGDATALDALLREYWRPLQRYAVRLLQDSDLAQDLVQETFVRLWLKRMDLEPGSLRSFLYRVLHNLALDDLRKRQVRNRSLRRLVAEGPDEVVEPVEDVARPEVESAVTSAINDLPARRREAFVLAYLHQLSYREIAEVMQISPATVKNQIAAALMQLREQLRGTIASFRDVE
jgi:RNA polymerase sigma-70 factor (ECF subfamily)